MFRRLIFFIIGLCVVIGIGFSSSTTHAQNSTWTAQYFNNTSLSGSPAATATLSNLNINWGHDAPATGVNVDDWTARFSTITYFNAGTYRFTIHADDAFRLYVHGKLLIDTFSNPKPDQTMTAEITLNAGDGSIQIDFREYIGPAFLYVSWTQLNGSYTNTTGWGQAQLTVNTSILNLRSEPTIGNNIIAKLPKGATYPIIGKTSPENWYQIQVGQITGWVFAPLVIAPYTVNVPVVGTNGSVPVPTKVAQLTITTGKLNVRSAPFVGDNVITRVAQGETYPIYGINSTKDWYLIKVGSTLGWVSAGFVDAVNTAGVPIINVQLAAPNVPTILTGYTLRSIAYLNIRSGPSLQFSRLSILPYNATASIIARNSNNSWWLIYYNGVIGWVYREYIVLPDNLNYGLVPVA